MYITKGMRTSGMAPRSKIRVKKSKSPVSAINCSPPPTPSKWERWDILSLDDIDTLFGMYNIDSCKDLCKAISRPPSVIEYILNEQPIYSWHPLLIVFYSMTNSCMNHNCNLGGNCGFYHSKNAKRTNKSIKIEIVDGYYHVFYNTIGRNNIRSPCSYKSDICVNPRCKENTHQRNRCSFYHNDEDRFNIKMYCFKDLIRAFDETHTNYQTELVAWSTSMFLLK